jgi:outer membrane protein, multidrug efflux system
MMRLSKPAPLLVAMICMVANGRGFAAAPEEWYAPLPHNGQVSELARWWEQFDDPLLSELIAAGQRVSPSIAEAQSRIVESRTARVAAGAALLPNLDALAQGTRGRQEVDGLLTTSDLRQVQLSWELDVFGANRANRTASQARLDAAYAAWHEARVSVAAEIAASYVQLRACQALLQETERDAASRAETSRLTELSARSGLQSSSSAALARASAAQGNSVLTQQRVDCERQVKALVALVDIDEPTLREKLQSRSARIPRPSEIAVLDVPAAALAQRPDVYAAARELVAASADLRRADAARYPRISLTGRIGSGHVEATAGEASGTTWSVGPVTVSIPLFDGGRRRAETEAARARQETSIVAYNAKIRAAVKEVEDTLLRLQGAAERSPDVERAANDFETSLQAANTRYQRGLANLFELESARRDAVHGRTALIELERERVYAWIALYRALGGGWSMSDDALRTALAGN